MRYKSRAVCLAGIQEISLILLYLLSALSLSKLIIWMYSNFFILKLVSLTQIKDVTSTLQKVNIKEWIFSVEIGSFLARKKKTKEADFQKS